jgi:dephospho-CoA kinase
MTKIIGLTGGIGSGKTTIAKKFLERGVPIYNADERSKLLLDQTDVIQEITAVFGNEILAKNNKIDRKKLAQIVFQNPEELQKLNQILHPKVGLDFKNWVLEHQNHLFLIKEAAILIESGSYKSCDYIILVKASLENRIKRVIARDKTTEKEVIDRINNQWSDEKKEPLVDFIIQNDDINTIDNQIDKIINEINTM